MKKYLFFILAVTLFAITSTILDLFNYNPFQSGLYIFINFYVSFALSVIGILGITFFYLKIKINKGNASLAFLFPSIREAGLIALALISLMILKGLKVLDWWIGIPLVVSIILLELFFQTSSPNVKHKKLLKKDQAR